MFLRFSDYRHVLLSSRHFKYYIFETENCINKLVGTVLVTVQNIEIVIVDLCRVWDNFVHSFIYRMHTIEPIRAHALSTPTSHFYTASFSIAWEKDHWSIFNGVYLQHYTDQCALNFLIVYKTFYE